MFYPITRLRRLRNCETIRAMVRENHLSIDDLIYPLFAIYGRNVKNPVASMPGVFQLSVDNVVKECGEVVHLGLKSVLLFGIPETKDEAASGAYDPDGIVQQAIRAIKKEFPGLYVITDVCLCEYTSHGHCGMISGDTVLNDPTLNYLADTALSHAVAGADMVAPSDMMDGRVGAIRTKLDQHGFSHIPIMAYSAKFASAFYGPFRDVAESAPQFGDRKAYQMDPANGDEAVRETALDIEEGADIVMVKPGLPYLDLVRRIKDEFHYPTAVYNVSGEYSMVKAAALNGWIDEKRIVMEALLGMKRAGADLIITYHAKDAARWMGEKA
ncbi:delta-aminolevulinic acid dehydratase [Candidatus Formimonas warabiya]|uniref:Delta-aminolevulinic acid dehydratase n=2 Tax=Formimonas warabiya TaxID=1761012 RepID=A0A3G1KPU6_FORW1|nr:delta-aminolevulinic acid dehydratase [Candidatus Formimonas warabiya]